LGDLGVWQEAHELTVQLYVLTDNYPRSEIFGLMSQIRRAAGSIGANLAEGRGRWSEVELARYVQIAKGSASELQNDRRLAKHLGFARAENCETTVGALTNIRKVLTAFLQTLRRSQKVYAQSTSGQQPRVTS
jgi:four helix bundle protein